MPQIQLEKPLLILIAQLALIVIVFLVADRMLNLAADRSIRRLEKDVINTDRLGKFKTLIHLVRSVLFIALLIISALMVLDSLGINITPLLTGAGIAGLALSLGAQTLIKDFISGTLLLLEGQFKIGDIVQIGELNGTVEKINLRTTYLRNFEGRLHAIPNGEIRALSNLTSDWARAVVDLNVAYEVEMKRVIEVLQNALMRLAEDPEIKESLLGTPEVSAWNGMTEWAVQVRLMIKTLPGKQWAVASVMRRVAIEALHEEGIQLQRPRQVVDVQGNLVA